MVTGQRLVLTAVRDFDVKARVLLVKSAQLTRRLDVRLGGAACICTAIHPVLSPTATLVMGETVVVPPTARELRDSRSVHELVRGREISRRNHIVMAGEPVSLLPAIAERWKADALVMGAVSRSG